MILQSLIRVIHGTRFRPEEGAEYMVDAAGVSDLAFDLLVHAGVKVW